MGIGRQDSGISWIDRFVLKKDPVKDVDGRSSWAIEKEAEYREILSKKSPAMMVIRGQVMVSTKSKAGWIFQLAT